jgi:activator of the mannose operon (transcriptional antiterminator)
MMNERDLKLIRYMVQQNDFRTSNEIATYLSVSPRTVMRIVKSINEADQPDQLIISEKGRGYKLDYDVYLRFSNQMNDLGSYSPTERRNEVLLNLLFRAPQPVALNELFGRFFISETVVNKDVLLLNQQIEQHGLRLVKHSQELSVNGSERAVRQLIISAIGKMGITDYQSMKKEFTDLGTFDMQFIIGQIDFIEEELRSTIPAPYNINLFTHVYILIKRYRQGLRADTGDEQLDEEEERQIQENPVLYSISAEVIGHLGAYLSREIPAIEKYYILQYLISSRLLSTQATANKYSPRIQAIVNDIVKMMSRQFGERIDSDELRVDLAQHVKPLLNRLDNGIHIENTMLHDISSEYPRVYTETRTAVNAVLKKYLDKEVSDDEIGFLALYFIKYLEQNPRQINALIMCASGVGTSELLKVKVHKYFPQLHIEDVLSLRQYQKNRAQYDAKTDLIITTVRTDEINSTRPIILVNVMFTASDQNRVAEKIKELSSDEHDAD